MYRCHNCNVLFNKTEPIRQGTGEVFNTCPGCNDTDYDEVWQCRLCNDWFYAHDITKHTCHECAKKAYNVHLGLKYVGQQKTDFFLYHLWGIERMDKDFQSDLSEILENRFIDELDLETDFNGHLKDLKEYCLDDIDSWIEFLEEEM